MRVVSFFFLLPIATFAFSPCLTPRVPTQLEAVQSRREALATVGAFFGVLSLPKTAAAFSQQLDDYVVEPSQQATDGRVNVNGKDLDLTLLHRRCCYF